MLPYEEGIEKKVDDYLDIGFEDDEEDGQNKKEIKYERNFDVNAFKTDKFEVIFA